MDLMQLLLEKNISSKVIFNSLSEGLLIMGNDEQVIFANDSARNILKMDLQEVMPSQWSKRLGIFQVNQIQPLEQNELPIFRALRGTTLTDHRLFIRNEALSDGIFLSVNSVPLKDNDGKILGSMSTFRDITHRLQRERKIADERSFYLRLFNVLPAHIIINDLSGNILYCNDQFSKLFPDETIIGKRIEELLRPQKAIGELAELMVKVIESKKEVASLIEIQAPDGARRVIRILKFPILDNEGDIQKICSVGFDETDKVDQQRAIEHERIKSINASKLAALGTLAAEIGHEINNPLGIIKMSVSVLRSMLKDGDSMENINEQIRIVDVTTTRINDIVSALKHISHDSKNEKFKPCHLQEILNDVKALCGTKFKLKNIDLVIDTSQIDVSKQVSCMRIQISQVLLNVLVNACDVIVGMKNAWVNVTLTEDKLFYYFKVSDSGPGITPEVRERLFEPFFTTKELGAGTGLGLSIAKDIMQRHRGDIYLDTEAGPNCFVIKLPK